MQFNWHHFSEGMLNFSTTFLNKFLNLRISKKIGGEDSKKDEASMCHVQTDGCAIMIRRNMFKALSLRLYVCIFERQKTQ